MNKPSLIHKAFLLLFISLFLLFSHSTCFAYLIRHALSLEKIAEESNVIFKAKVVNSDVLTWGGGFKKYGGFEATETKMELISVIKGELPQRTIFFRHYAQGPPTSRSRMIGPQFYDLKRGRTYIVFAKNTKKAGTTQQLWENPTAKEDQGVILVFDENPVDLDKPLKDIVWGELTNMLNSNNTQNIEYAITQLDSMSRPAGWGKLDDFDRDSVMQEIHSFAGHENKDVAHKAITALGWGSPYLPGDNAVSWLAKVSGKELPGHAPWPRGDDNAYAKPYWKTLAAAANGSGPATNRALAIRALGLTKVPEIYPEILKWVEDDEPFVRQAAVKLLADFPGNQSAKIIINAAQDMDPLTRLAAARAIGLGQYEELISYLDNLLDDENINVSSAAYVNLLSFSLDKTRDILRKRKDQSEWKALFVNPLAEEDPEPYIDDLAEIVDKNLGSKHFRGGTIPSFLSWKILFKYLQQQDNKKITNGDFDKHFDALENAKYHGSSEPRDLYSFYLHHKLDTRARNFREKCKTAVLFDMTQFLDRVDQAEDFYINSVIYSNYGLNLDQVGNY